MSGDAFAGLRPVAKRQVGGDLNRKTARIVLPTSTDEGSFAPPVVGPPRAVPVPKAVVKKRFSLVAVSPTLQEVLPQGILLTPGWLFIGSNPSLELPAFMALVLHLDGVSKEHAAVTEFNDKPFVTDLGSTNGTRLFRNQETIEIKEEPVELLAGDILWIGPAFFQVVQS